ncbi:MAG: MaoC family dehydratase [Microscillaceae bacterium]|nr:MaoC family dehydratase [Microscillaceae bacterium]
MLFFEDFSAGQIFELGNYTVIRDEVLEFAQKYDPQPFHLDDEAARQSLFGSLAASGWHTAAMYMRMYVDGLLSKSASLGSPGVDELRWLKPVYPNDTLTAKYRVTETRTSEKRPQVGIVAGECEMYNQKNELVMTFKGVGFMRRRPTD